MEASNNTPVLPLKKKLGRRPGSNKDKPKPKWVKSVRPKRAGVYVTATDRIHPFYSKHPFSDHTAHLSDEFQAKHEDLLRTLATISRAAAPITNETNPAESKSRMATIKRHCDALAHKLRQWEDMLRRTLSADMLQTIGSLMHLRDLAAPEGPDCFTA